ncbi:uncharacterized protein [Spinacia oleracea]|uniref:Uncharacterized protein n=1 Tax=Spinacia oleracea TaxID=3562 RepID=A0ABM3RR37_SPIOL|nr:uncharacterized protein LOC110792719 [Spinacia oleracea]
MDKKLEEEEERNREREAKEKRTKKLVAEEERIRESEAKDKRTKELEAEEERIRESEAEKAGTTEADQSQPAPSVEEMEEEDGEETEGEELEEEEPEEEGEGLQGQYMLKKRKEEESDPNMKKLIKDYPPMRVYPKSVISLSRWDGSKGVLRIRDGYEIKITQEMVGAITGVPCGRMKWDFPKKVETEKEINDLVKEFGKFNGGIDQAQPQVAIFDEEGIFLQTTQIAYVDRIKFGDSSMRWEIGAPRLGAWTSEEICQVIESDKSVADGTFGHAEVVKDVVYVPDQTLRKELSKAKPKKKAGEKRDNNNVAEQPLVKESKRRRRKLSAPEKEVIPPSKTSKGKAPKETQKETQKETKQGEKKRKAISRATCPQQKKKKKKKKKKNDYESEFSEHTDTDESENYNGKNHNDDDSILTCVILLLNSLLDEQILFKYKNLQCNRGVLYDALRVGGTITTEENENKDNLVLTKEFVEDFIGNGVHITAKRKIKDYPCNHREIRESVARRLLAHASDELDNREVFEKLMEKSGKTLDDSATHVEASSSRGESSMGNESLDRDDAEEKSHVDDMSCGDKSKETTLPPLPTPISPYPQRFAGK